MRLTTEIRRRLGRLPWPGVVRDVVRYRAFVVGSIRRDVEAQFRGSLLGSAWVLLQPLAMIAVYTLVFAQVMGSRLPGVASMYGYSIYLCAGLLAWNFFADSLSRLQGVFVNNGNLIKKAAFPRVCLPLIALGGAAFSFVLIFSIFLLFLLFSGQFPGWVLLGLLPALAVQLLLTAGLGMLAATLNVFFRDVGQLVSLSLMFWFWLTPIVYPLSALPDWAQRWVWLNPFTVLAHHYQQVLLNARLPAPWAWEALAWVALLALGLTWCGWRLYRARAPEMADEL